MYTSFSVVVWASLLCTSEWMCPWAYQFLSSFHWTGQKWPVTEPECPIKVLVHKFQHSVSFVREHLFQEYEQMLELKSTWWKKHQKKCMWYFLLLPDCSEHHWDYNNSKSMTLFIQQLHQLHNPDVKAHYINRTALTTHNLCSIKTTNKRRAMKFNKSKKRRESKRL